MVVVSEQRFQRRTGELSRFIGTGETSRMLGLSTSYVLALEEKGELVPVYRLGEGRFARRVYCYEDVERLAAERQARQSARPAFA